MSAGDLKEFEEGLWVSLKPLKNDPDARIRSRCAFYKKYGQEGDSGSFGYGDSEIAFLTWEKRAVLRPVDGAPPGSPWWNDVNLWFIYLSELGAKAYETGMPIYELPVPSQFWLRFIQQPNAVNWYKAHNSSIIDGYLKFSDLAEKETVPEKIFINMVLYRLLFAQSLVEGDFPLPKLGKIMGDPRGRSVQFVTSLDAYYPAHYPMTGEEIREVLGKSHRLSELGVEFLDDVLVEPELTQLYQEASTWNNQPALMNLIVNHKPAYPNGERLPDTQKAWIIVLIMWLRKLFFKIF
ncbi:hypothetical protein [Dyadobacter fanqingshengii]|uniref:Uncharacterized protein n=1 Tax=Dyadobacter fanqingshengii TaxID=2906443 RepID=A0A9X1TA31_9BACT|nr:hypothetical protein [Dyadobacter fanqingshengii]MCF0041286.1 hypothetical protein [Dyadobacter fanqingshengii]USJ36989.1 hypothetical protein NFI81_04270 [Dyadobacter fanqingshengii]